jgi:type IV fimbrial biogenesis protein FimT
VKDSRQQIRSQVRPRAPRRLHAFTLQESLVTLTVVGIISVYAVPSFQQLVARQRISAAVNTLITALHLARSEAIKRGTKAALCPSADGQACRDGDTIWEDGYLLYIDDNGNHAFDSNESVVWRFDTAEGLNIRSTVGRDHITYQPNGMVAGTNLTFTLCEPNGLGLPRAVIVSTSGRVRASTRNANGSAIVCPMAS